MPAYLVALQLRIMNMNYLHNHAFQAIAMNMITVESPTRGHFRAAAIVLCSEIVLCWEFDFIIHFLPLTE